MGEKTADETYDLYEMLGANSQQKSSRGRRMGVNEVAPGNDMAMQIAELTKQIALLTSKNTPTQEVCGICSTYGHGANICPFVCDQNAGTSYEQANAMEGYQPRPRNDPYSNTYNPGWRNHPNFSWKGNNNQGYAQNNFPHHPNNNNSQPTLPNKPSLEDNLNSFIQVSQEINQKNDQRIGSLEASMKRIETQVGQLTEYVHKQDKGKMPEQLNAITVIESGEVLNYNFTEHSDDLFIDAGDTGRKHAIPKESQAEDIEVLRPSVKCTESLKELTERPSLHKSPNPYRPPIPLPHPVKATDQDKLFHETFTSLSKVNINLPLLNIIRDIPSYPKFLKTLLSNKRKYKNEEKVIVSELASVVLQKKLPPKLKDPGSFNIKITLGDKMVSNAMLDLGASINVMPYSVYLQLGLRDLKPTNMSLHLADKSIRYPKGIVDGLLVQVKSIIVPVDFVVMEMEDTKPKDNEHTIILGRPFMATTNTIIDVQRGKLTMRVLGETINFKVFNPLLTAPISSANNCVVLDSNDLPIFDNNLQKGSYNKTTVSSTDRRVKETLTNSIQDNAYKDHVKWSQIKNLDCEFFYPGKDCYACNTRFKSFSGDMKPCFEKSKGRGGSKHFKDALRPP